MVLTSFEYGSTDVTDDIEDTNDIGETEGTGNTDDTEDTDDNGDTRGTRNTEDTSDTEDADFI